MIAKANHVSTLSRGILPKGVADIVYLKYQNNKFPNSRGYVQPRQVRIRGRIDTEPMQLFGSSKNKISAKTEIGV